MTASRTPLDRQCRDLSTLIDAARRGEKLRNAEFEMLEAGVTAALHTMEFCRDNAEAIRTVLKAAVRICKGAREGRR